MTYYYNLSTDFANGLTNHLLKKTINELLTINCVNVSTEEDIVKIKFDSNLSDSEENTLNDIIEQYIYSVPPSLTISDNFRYTNYENIMLTKTMSKVINSNIEHVLNDWSHVDGYLSGFENDTGVFTIPESGVYCFGCFAGITTNDNTSEISCRIFNTDNGLTRYLDVSASSDLASSSGFNGACTFSCTNIFFKGEKLSIGIRCNSTETFTFILRCVRIC